MHSHHCCPPHHPFSIFLMGGRHRRHRPPPWLFHMMGGSARAEKGEVRYLILDAIADAPRHGYEVIQKIEEKSGGNYKPSPGTVYPTLQLLEEMGHASANKDGNRTVYEITEEGKQDLKEHQDEVDEAYERLGGHSEWAEDFDFESMGDWARKFKRTVKSAFRHGRIGPQEFRDIGEVLEETAKKIEDILRRK